MKSELMGQDSSSTPTGKLPPILTLRVDTPATAMDIGGKARQFAAEIGFPPVECDEIALVATELATNIVKHAGGGQLQFAVLVSGSNAGIQIASEDYGPGIRDPENALADGYSSSGSLGNGLGTVNRLMDVLEWFPQPEAGVRIICQRWLRPGNLQNRQHRLEFGAASRSYMHLPENGDAIVIRQWSDHALAGVIDGLGHGRFAQRAANAARDYVERHFNQPLEALFRGVGRACRATRGVVMALAHFDLKRQTVEIASVGNVEVHLLGAPRPSKIIVRRGVVGMSGSPRPVTSVHDWTPVSVLILHSDGVETHWLKTELQELLQATPAFAARQLLQRHGRREDDATVIVARNAK